MNVRVAVRTFHANIGKNQVGMALPARHPLMHSAQGKLGCVVIEFRHVADRLPRRERMAVLAGDIQIAVRAMRTLGGRRRLSRNGTA